MKYTAPATSLLFLFASAVSSIMGQPSGSISGVVLAKNNKPLEGVIVFYIRNPYREADKVPLSAVSVTAKDGTFRFTSLLDGQYQICTAARPDLEVYNICDWETSAPAARVSPPNRNVTGVAIQLENAVRVEIELDDPDRIVPTPDIARGKRGSIFKAGLQADKGPYVSLRAKSRTASGLTYEAMVPHGKPVRLELEGPDFEFRDDKGAKLFDTPNNKPAFFTVTPADSKKSIKISVKEGKKP